jgi:hypothetical protein
MTFRLEGLVFVGNSVPAHALASCYLVQPPVITGKKLNNGRMQ